MTAANATNELFEVCYLKLMITATDGIIGYREADIPAHYCEPRTAPK